MIVTYDLETTGFINKKLPLGDPLQPRIVQLGMILDDEVGNERMRLDIVIRHDLEALPGSVLENWYKAADIHGISPELADQIGITEEIAIDMLLDFLAVAETVVGHNHKSYDNDVVRCSVQRLLGADAPDPFRNVVNMYDTMLAGTPVCGIRKAGGGGYKSPKLTELHQYLFEEGFEGAHTAIADVLACRRCYYELIDLAREKAN